MIKVFLDPGHGGRDSGAVGHGLMEKNINLLVCKEMMEVAKREKLIEFIPSRTTDEYLTLGARTSKEISSNVEASISVHCNAGGQGYGTETYYYSTSEEGKKLATLVNNKVHAVVNRRNRGIKNGDSFALINGTKSTAILVEIAFISDSADAKILKNKVKEIAKAIYDGVKDMYDVKGVPVVGTPIMHISKSKVPQMVQFLRDGNPNPDIDCSIEYLCELYIKEGLDEGVAGDIAFCQAIHETLWFRDIKGKNNFGGFEDTWFPSVETAVRAHIQRLKGYASVSKLNKSCVDLGYSKIEKGSARNWEQLNGKWENSDSEYGQDILRLHKQMLKEVVQEEDKNYQVTIQVGSKEEAEHLLEIFKNATMREV